MINISPPTRDADRIAPILRTLRTAHTDEIFKARLRAAIEDGYQAFLAEDGRDVIGCLGFRFSHDVFWGKSLYIDDLVVCRDSRNQGIGAKLLREARQLAEREACDHIRLASGLARADAHRFYEKNAMTKASFQFALPLSAGDN